MTIFDRATRCFLSWRVVHDRTAEVAQQILYEAPAKRYYSDRSVPQLLTSHTLR
jgi:hypothetical protein